MSNCRFQLKRLENEEFRERPQPVDGQNAEGFCSKKKAEEVDEER